METILLRIMCDRFFSDNSKVSEISNILIYYGSLILGILLKTLCLYERLLWVCGFQHYWEQFISCCQYEKQDRVGLNIALMLPHEIDWQKLFN